MNIEDVEFAYLSPVEHRLIFRDGTQQDGVAPYLNEHSMEVFLNGHKAMELVCVPQFLPELVLGVVKDLAGLTTPLSFLSIGVTLSLGMVARKSYLISGVALRLAVIPAIFLPIGVMLGFRGQELCALLILLAAPTAVSSYPMAVAMDADGEFAAQMVAYTTVFCLPTIFIFTWVLNTFGFM